MHNQRITSDICKENIEQCRSPSEKGEKKIVFTSNVYRYYISLYYTVCVFRCGARIQVRLVHSVFGHAFTLYHLLSGWPHKYNNNNNLAWKLLNSGILASSTRWWWHTRLSEVDVCVHLHETHSYGIHSHTLKLKCGLFVERFTFDKPVITYFSNCGHDECKKNTNSDANRTESSVCFYFFLLLLFCLQTFLSNLWRRGCRCYSIQIFCLRIFLVSLSCAIGNCLRSFSLLIRPLRTDQKKDWFLIDPSIRPSTATHTSITPHTYEKEIVIIKVYQTITMT